MAGFVRDPCANEPKLGSLNCHSPTAKLQLNATIAQKAQVARIGWNNLQSPVQRFDSARRLQRVIAREGYFSAFAESAACRPGAIRPRSFPAELHDGSGRNRPALRILHGRVQVVSDGPVPFFGGVLVDQRSTRRGVPDARLQLLGGVSPDR